MPIAARPGPVRPSAPLAWSRAALRLSALLVVASLLAVACGGGGDNGSGEDGSGAGSADSDGAGEPGDGDSGDGSTDDGDTTAAVPVTGALVSVTAFGLGFFAIDPDSGEARLVELEGVGFTDRNQPAVLGESGAAWVLGYTTVEGQSFTNRVQLARVDLATGERGVVAELGQDRENDDATDTTTWQVIGEGAGTVWLVERTFSAAGETFVGIDAASGAESARFAYADEQRPFDPVVLDGAVYARVNGEPARLDPATGAFDQVASVSEDLAMIDHVASAELGAFTVTRDGSEPTEDEAASLLGFGDVGPGGASWIAGDGALWWVMDESWTTQSGLSVVLGGIVRFDPTTATVTGIWPIGDRYATWEDETTYASMSQAELMVRDGVLWIIDGRDDGPIGRLDPSTGAIDFFEVDRPAGIDHTRVEALATDPDAVWVVASDWTLTSEDDSGRSFSGVAAIERIDPTTGAPVVSVPVTDLTAG